MVEVKSVPDLIKEISSYYKKKGKPDAEHLVVYDSSTETLEPLYFFILDLMNDRGLRTEKLIDNYSPSPGSGHFSELGGKKSVMQKQGAELLGSINTVLRSVLNIIYDLREFKIRLQSYDDLKDYSKKEAAILSLKQIWMDKVDIEKGNSSIKAMALSQAGFVTLLDAFLAVKDIKAVDKLDLNDRVKRILIPRLSEFSSWLVQSENELRKRYEIEKTYLKSQVDSLKLYSRWAKPYLKAAQELEMKDMGREPALVKVFNTLIIEISLFGKIPIDVKSIAQSGEFPVEFSNERFLKKLKRKYYSCLLVEFKFRGIPQRIPNRSDFAFGGRAEISFKAYALNDQELEKLNKKMEESDLNDAFGLIKGITEDSLDKLKDDIEYFLSEEKSQEVKKPRDTSNPFLALFGKYVEKVEKKEKPKEEKKEIIVAEDDWNEREFFRKKAVKEAQEIAFFLFDVYKKAHGMASFEKRA